MDYSYLVGLQASIWAGAIAVVIGVSITVMMLIRNADWRSAGDIASDFAVAGMVGILLSGVAGLVVFCAAFTILNPLLQAEQLHLARIPTLVEQELRNGVFGLRFASLLICYRTLAYIAQWVLVDELRYFDRFFDRPSENTVHTSAPLGDRGSGMMNETDSSAPTRDRGDRIPT